MVEAHAGLKVLLVDDQPAILRTLLALLRLNGNGVRVRDRDRCRRRLRPRGPGRLPHHRHRHRDADYLLKPFENLGQVLSVIALAESRFRGNAEELEEPLGVPAAGALLQSGLCSAATVCSQPSSQAETARASESPLGTRGPPREAGP